MQLDSTSLGTRVLPFLAIFAAALHPAPALAAPSDRDSSSKLEVWPAGAVCAVSLTYDDGRAVHHQHVAPLLESHGLHATFYLSIQHVRDPDEWTKVAARGHELGNHSLFHPCRREPAEKFGWLAEDYDLANYSPQRFHDELELANKFIDLLDGGRPRTYGNNCTNLTIGRGDREQPMDPILEQLFVAARGTVTREPVDPMRPVFTRLGHYSGDGKTFDQLRAEIEQARERGGWIIYMFHGVGQGTHSLFIDDKEHRKLVEWLDGERTSIWTAPVVDVARHLKTRPRN